MKTSYSKNVWRTFPALLLAVVLVPFLSQPLHARPAGGPGASSEEADEDIEEAYREMATYTSGRVISANDAAQTIVVRDEQGDANTYSYAVRADTSFTGVRSLRDIKAGDMVRVDYFTIEGKDVATGILMEKRYSSPSEMNDPDYKMPGDLVDIGSEPTEIEGSSGSNASSDGVLKDLSD
ncbi:MAG: hypothetical protein ABIJ27_00235 [Candidatus Omnitrophota bacterium]